MEESNFKVDAQVLVNSEGRQVLVAVSLLGLEVNEVIGLERQPSRLVGRRPSRLGHQSSSSGALRPTQKCLPLEAQDIELDDYHIHELERQTVFAHAIAVCSHSPEAQQEGRLPHSTDDQFLFVDIPKGQETLCYAKRDLRVEVFSLNTGQRGFLDATCLSFFPHYKVATSFTWDIDGSSKVENAVGQYFTIGQRSWIMSWTPEGTTKSTPHLCTFGRNMNTRYSGVVPMEKLAELNPWELERWKCENAFPLFDPGTAHVHRNPVVFCEHAYGGPCFADAGPDLLEPFRGKGKVPC